MITKIRSISSVVREILTEYPETRNSDRLLILKVWAAQNPYLRNKTHSFVEFSKGFIGNEYADTESIRRSRQKIQQESPELKGTMNNQKQGLAEGVRANINT